MRKPACSDKREDGRVMYDDNRSNKKHEKENSRTTAKSSGLHLCEKIRELQRCTKYPRPDLEFDNFGEDEDDLIIKLHALLGDRWSLIAGRLPGRSDNEIKNYWNRHLKWKLIKMGIDPNNHRLSNWNLHHYTHLKDNVYADTASSSAAALPIAPSRHIKDTLSQKRPGIRRMSHKVFLI